MFLAFGTPNEFIVKNTYPTARESRHLGMCRVKLATEWSFEPELSSSCRNTISRLGRSCTSSELLPQRDRLLLVPTWLTQRSLKSMFLLH